jgi:outer membrane protein assembly factor BamB
MTLSPPFDRPARALRAARVRSLVTTGLVGLSMSLAASCHQLDKRAEHKTSLDPNYGFARAIWRTRIIDMPYLAYRPLNQARAAVAKDTDRVFVGVGEGEYDINGTFVALDANDGRVLWKWLHSGPINSQALYVPGKAGTPVSTARVFFGTDDGFMVALDADTGKELWKYQSRGLVRSRPVYADGRLVFANDQNFVFALDAVTGKWLWHYNRPLPDGFAIDGVAPPIVSGSRVIAGLGDGAVVSLNLEDGGPNWVRQLGKPGDFRNINAELVLDGENVLVPVYNEGLSCLKAATGDELWRIDVTGPGTPVVVKGRVYLGDAKARMLAYDMTTRERVWSFQFKEGFAVHPVYHRGFLTFATFADTVIVLRAKDGKLVDAYEPGRGFGSSAVIERGIMYLLTNSGMFYALRVLDLHPKARG